MPMSDMEVQSATETWFTWEEDGEGVMRPTLSDRQPTINGYRDAPFREDALRMVCLQSVDGTVELTSDPEVVAAFLDGEPPEPAVTLPCATAVIRVNPGQLMVAVEGHNDQRCSGYDLATRLTARDGTATLYDHTLGRSALRYRMHSDLVEEALILLADD